MGKKDISKINPEIVKKVKGIVDLFPTSFNSTKITIDEKLIDALDYIRLNIVYSLYNQEWTTKERDGYKALLDKNK